MSIANQTTLKIRRLSVLLASLLVLAFAAPGKAVADFDPDVSPLPAPTSPVMDYAGVVDAETEDRIERKILEFAESSQPKVELAVAVVDTTGEVPIFDYSLAVARGWGIGTTSDDNPGALLFVAINDRKYFTQISYDLEDELSDGTVGSIQRRFLVPEFRKGNYGKGIEDTIDAYIQTIQASQAGEANPFQPAEREEAGPVYDDGPDVGEIICCAAAIIGVVIFVVWGISNEKKGGGKGGRKKSTGSAAADFATGLIIGALTSGGSGSSSGSSWGGSSGGGGWGGFSGGGSFGGGGSGGSW